MDWIPNKQSKNKEIINTILGLAQWTIGNVEETLRTLKDNVTDIKMEVMLAVVLAELSIEQGHLNQATQIYERALYNAIHGNALLHLPISH